jgi:hypothetical protein
MGKGASTEQVVREIQRRTRRRFSAEEKVRIVLEGLRGELDCPRFRGRLMAYALSAAGGSSRS